MQTQGFSISKQYRLICVFLCGMVFCSSNLLAQISAPAANSNSKTEYTNAVDQDDIFIFCDAVGANVGELNAVSPDGASGWSFTWTKWDSGTNTFGGAYPIENGQESTLKDLANGLYRVSVEKTGETNRVYQAWVINHLKNTNQPSFIKTKMDCFGVYFTSSYAATKYQYFDFPSTNVLEIETTSIFSFKRDGEELQRLPFPDYDGAEKKFIDDKAFEDDAEYEITVIDECGFEYTSDPIISKTYVVNAIFTFDPATGEAPLEVSFDTDKPNATSFQWFFYQDETRIDGPVPPQDSLLTDVKTGSNEIYKYLHPGKYFVKLIATNNDDAMNCVHKFISNEIVVEGSIFEVPNVFTPNGDGVNDEFKVKLYSVKSYSVKIFNRWGRLVYEFQESDVPAGMVDGKSSKGWNGKINGKLASPGTYFYVIEAEGREEDGKHYSEKGSFMLLHNK